MTAGRRGSRSDGGSTDGELLAATADRLRWHAPELTLVFARQATTRADETRDRVLALRAKSLVVAALVRLGKHAEAVEPAVSTLRAAENAGDRELAGAVRVDLAASTRAVGLTGSAFVIVRPMLEGSDARPAVRAGALGEIVAGLAQAGRLEVIDEVFSEADRLYAADDLLSGDVRRVLRALLCARIASFRRRWGNATGAVAAATEGMTLLDGLADPGTDAGQARAELGLEMVSALLDAGEETAALGQADQTLNQPVRAASAAAIGRLMLIVATRVHFPAGRPKEAHALLAEIVRVAHRHELDGLLADVLTALAAAQETDGDLTEALNSLRSAHAAEQRRLRADTLARMVVLEELGAGTRLPDDTEALLRRVVRTPARTASDLPGTDLGSRDMASREMSGRELAGRDIGPGPRPRPTRGAGTYDSVGYERTGRSTESHDYLGDDASTRQSATGTTQDYDLSALYTGAQGYDLEGYPTVGGMATGYGSAAYGTAGGEGGEGGGGGGPGKTGTTGSATGGASSSRYDLLGRELAGWEMVARERAAMDLAGQTRAGSDLVAADRAAPDWAGADPSTAHSGAAYSDAAEASSAGRGSADPSAADPGAAYSSAAERGTAERGTTDFGTDDFNAAGHAGRDAADPNAAADAPKRDSPSWAPDDVSGATRDASDWSTGEDRVAAHRSPAEWDRDTPEWADREVPEWAGADPAAVDRVAGRAAVDRAAVDLAAMDLPTVDIPTVDEPGAGGAPETRSSWAASAVESPTDWAGTASAALAASAAIAAATGAEQAESQPGRRKGKRAADADKPKWPDTAQNERDEETGLLNRQGLRRRLAAARRQARPTALTLVRLEPSGEAELEPEPRRKDPDSTDRFSAALIKAIDTAGRIPPEIDPDVLTSLADHVRDMAPDDAELARPDEGELAVLLPDTTRDEAEQFAATLRETVSASDWDPQDPARGVSVSTGVAQYQEGTSEDAFLSAAREALNSADQEQERADRPDWQSVEPVYDLPPGDSGYTYMEGYTGLTSDGPDPEMAEYLAGFPLPDVGRKWPSTGDAPFPELDDAAADEDEAGRSVLDRLDISRGSGGRRRASDEVKAAQSAGFDQYAIDQPMRTYSNTGDEILAAAEEAERASIPLPPDPDEIPAPPDEPDIPTPPDGPEVPVPPDPDVEPEPRPGRRRRSPQPTQPGEDPDADPRPGHGFPLGPDIPSPPDPDADPDPRRRRWTSELDPENPRARRRALPRDPTRRAVEPDDEPAGRRRMPEPADDARTPQAGRRRMPESPEQPTRLAEEAQPPATNPAHPTGSRRTPDSTKPEPDTAPGRRRMPDSDEPEARAAAGRRTPDPDEPESGVPVGRRRMPDVGEPESRAVAGRGVQGAGEPEPRTPAGRRVVDSDEPVPDTAGRRRTPDSDEPAARAAAGRRRVPESDEPEPGAAVGRRRMPEPVQAREPDSLTAAPGESTGRRRMPEFAAHDESPGEAESTGRRRMPEPLDREENPESTGRRRTPESQDPDDIAGHLSIGRRRMPDSDDEPPRATPGAAESVGRRRAPETVEPADPAAPGRRAKPRPGPDAAAPTEAETTGRRRKPDTAAENTGLPRPPDTAEPGAAEGGQSGWPSDPLGLDAIFDRPSKPRDLPAAGDESRRSPEPPTAEDTREARQTPDPLGLDEILGEAPTTPQARSRDDEHPSGRDEAAPQPESTGRRRKPEPPSGPDEGTGRAQQEKATSTGQAEDVPSTPAKRRNLADIADGFDEAARRRTSAEPATRRRPTEPDEPEPARRSTPGEATVRREFADAADKSAKWHEFADSADAPEPTGRRGAPGEATVRRRVVGSVGEEQVGGRRARPGEATVFQRQSDSLDGLDPATASAANAPVDPAAAGSGRSSALRRSLDTELVNRDSASGRDNESANRGTQGDGSAARRPGSGLPPEQAGPVDLDDFPRRRPAPAPPAPPRKDDREVFSLGPDGLSRHRPEVADRSDDPAVRPEPVEGTIQSDPPPVDELSRRRQSERQERQRRRAEQAADGAADDRPSRLRRRERSDLKLADLLAEALVAYQSSTSEGAGEDILSAYEDLDTARGDDAERHRGETGY
ncbi:hypothetical protein ALI144C_33700 [Actinosynnema sp. ALI-1.44]|uniref:diguanylate cyclase domain-containing protein n=1 Tax=Actinosynnema sp. ALI-1.44 TaxID=1933779 RepID=UPI00097C60FF|nr:diguanylate cyclase [Actinosynnema sp. ALI-1.44]ONI77060.1 hypothetical protein ALI144C_33700 [Actinosynnema sp. ALI-1.44]